MTPQQFSLSLPLRIVRLEGGAEIQEANGRRICFCDEYDAPQIVRSVNAFPELLAACKAACRDESLSEAVFAQLQSVIANAEREEQKV